jgi:energy-coupling factor transporter ATP-binding protein EcfA2
MRGFFPGHTVLVGDNNTGKSTILEAIDLVLGPERLSRYPVIDEHDFYAGQYLDKDANPIDIKVEVVVVDYDQYALLDLIEFIAQNCRDISNRIWHGFFGHDDLSFAKTAEVFKEFRKDINAIFGKTGLLYTLTESGVVERIIEHSVLSIETETAVKQVSEQGTKELLEEAIVLFKQPNPIVRKSAVEKIWDALERLKTYYTELDKKSSVIKIVGDMANSQQDFIKLFDDEFRTLTSIGNDFRIRHHEISKIDITDNRHYDYFFNRCLSLIALAIQYLR